MTSSELLGHDSSLPVVTFEGAVPVGDGVHHETYSITTADPNVVLKGMVVTSDRSTTLVVSEPRRADATEEDRATGTDGAGINAHTRIKVEQDHAGVGAPDLETKLKILSHLAAAMLFLTEEESDDTEVSMDGQWLAPPAPVQETENVVTRQPLSDGTSRHGGTIWG